jgi:hypothetical protein
MDLVDPKQPDNQRGAVVIRTHASVGSVPDMSSQAVVRQPLAGTHRCPDTIKIEAVASPEAVRPLHSCGFWRYAMSFESLMAASRRLTVSVEALAALGAELRLRHEGLEKRASQKGFAPSGK